MIKATPSTLIVCQLHLQPYAKVYQAMRQFTEQRDNSTADQIWLVQHPKVFTQGQAGKPEHLLIPSVIDVIQSDRGGQITYHAPGQQILYTLIDLKRKQLNVRFLVTQLENSVINTLAEFGLAARARREAPGVYIEDKKICSLGLRIRKGCSLHGLALNIDMDMQPFSLINPCGYPGLQMVQLKDLIPEIDVDQVTSLLVKNIFNLLGYASVEFHPWSFCNDE